MDWETLKTDCLACQRCPLHTTRHNVVFGQGVENAEVLFVGEGPGQSEDEQGLPFVGLYRQHRQVPPASEPRPPARRERSLYALAARAVPSAAA